MEKSRLPYEVYRIGMSDLGGEHTCGPEHEGMTAASKRAPYGNRCTGFVKRRPGPHEGKAAVVEEETGKGTPRAAGGGVQARRERYAETTSGRSFAQQGLPATCKDLVTEGSPEAQGGWRTAARARRGDEGGVTPADMVRDIMTGDGHSVPVQRGSGHVVAPGVAGHVGPGNNGAPGCM
jgi:hypothetical protein